MWWLWAWSWSFKMRLCMKMKLHYLIFYPQIYNEHLETNIMSAPNLSFHYLASGRVGIEDGYNHWSAFSSDHWLHVASCCCKNNSDPLTLQCKAHFIWRESPSKTEACSAKCIQVPKVKVVIMQNGPIKATICNSKSNLLFSAQPSLFLLRYALPPAMLCMATQV